MSYYTDKDRRPTGRFKAKNQLFHQFRAKVTEYGQDFDSNTPTGKAVRWLLVVVLVNLVVVLAMYARKTYFTPKTKHSNAIVKLEEAPSVPQTAPVVHAVVAPQTTPSTITQPNQVVAVQPVANITAPAQPNTPVLPTPVVQPTPATPTPTTAQPTATPAAPVAGSARHLVQTGDSWESIARDNNTTVDALKAVNPQITRLVSGYTLTIPAKPGEIVKVVENTTETKPEVVSYKIKKGETLSSIARKHKVSLRKLMEFNKIDDKAAKRIKIGQVIMIPSK